MSPSARPPDEPAAEQVRRQADQLAAWLRDRQSQLDHREAELNSRIARMESEERAERLRREERETELIAREQKLERQQRDMQMKTGTGTATNSGLDRATVQPVAEPVPIFIRPPPVSVAEQENADETAALRERMVAEHRAAMADLEQKRHAVQRRAEHVDQCRLALRRIRGELGRTHRETLETRLATEELWAQLSRAATPAALTQSLGRIRAKLAEQYGRASAQLAEQKQELEAIRKELAASYETLAARKRQFEQWLSDCRGQCQEQTSQLTARSATCR